MIEWFLWISVLFGMLGVPSLTVWGWVRWSKDRDRRTLFSKLSLIGFAFATASSGLALLTWLMASTKGFRFYDPLLLMIYKAGLLLSLAGLLFGILGVWRPGPVRWHALVCGLGMLCFWVSEASLE